MASLGTLAVNIVARTANFSRGVTKSIGLTQRFTSSILPLTAAIGASVGVLLKLTSAHEKLQRAMNNSLAIMGEISIAMRRDMQEAAIAVARATVFSTEQVAKGYFFLASAGLNAKQSIAALPAVAKFAQAGNFDLALATDLATDAQTAMGLTVDNVAKNLENMTHVTDVLTKANTIANASTQQFSESLTNGAGPALRAAGMDMEAGVAILAAFATQGIKGADAGTGLSIVLRDLSTKAIKNADAFRAQGIAVNDQNGNMRNMADILTDIERNMEGASTSQKKMTLLALGFTDKSIKYTQALIGMSGQIRKYEKSLRSAGGITEEVASKQMTVMQKATARLGAAWDLLASSMGAVVEVLADYVVGAARQIEVMSAQQQSIIHLADFLHALRISWLNVSVVIKGVAAGLLILVSIIVQLGEAIFGVKNGFGKMLDSWAKTLDASVAETSSQLSEALISKTPSEKMAAFFRKTKKEAEEAAKAVEKVTKPTLGGIISGKASGLFGKISGGLGGALGKAGGFAAKAEAKATSALLQNAIGEISFGLLGKKLTPAFAGATAGVDPRQQLSARTRGSVETFAAARRNLGGSNPINTVVKTGKQQLAETKKGNANLAKIAAKKEPQVVAIEGAT